MKVLFVNPPSIHEIRGPHPLKARDMGVFPHLGLMYIAAVLRQNNEFEVRLLDMSLEQSNMKDLIAVFRDLKPSVVGVTSYTDCLYDLKLIVEELRRESDTVTICMGGPHVEIYPKETLEVFPINCVIRGDGEYAFRELCRRVRDKKSWKDIGGVGYRDGSKVILNEPWQIQSLDELPFPTRELSNIDRVRSAVARGNAITSICSSRGCPFPCTFCNSPYKKYRLRSPENVAEEIVHCHEKFGLEEFFFFDDLFNLNRKRLMGICDAFERLPFDIKWSFRGRINCLDEEIIRRCRNAGCTRIHFGVETGTDRIQRVYKKRLNLDGVRRIFGICHMLGIETVANFIIGAPTETREEINQTLQFAYELNPTFVEFHVLVPYPYTEIYKNMLNSGYLKEDVWTEFARNPRPGFQPPLCEDTLFADELYRLLNKAYRRFYFRPSYILKQMLKLEGFTEFRKKAWGAYRLLVVTRNGS